MTTAVPRCAAPVRKTPYGSTMKTPPSPDPDIGLVVSMPRPVPDWGAQVLEYVYLLGTTLWMGVHSASVLLVVPLLADHAGESVPLARAIVGIFEMLGFVTSGAAGLLLIATLGMQVLKLRTPQAVLIQLILVLLMTVVAVLPHLMLVPKLSSALRAASLPPSAADEPPVGASESLTALLASLRGLGAMGMLHLFFGALLVGLGTRRCYRYPHSEVAPALDWEEGH